MVVEVEKAINQKNNQKKIMKNLVKQKVVKSNLKNPHLD